MNNHKANLKVRKIINYLFSNKNDVKFSWNINKNYALNLNTFHINKSSLLKASIFYESLKKINSKKYECVFKFIDGKITICCEKRFNKNKLIERMR